MTETALLTGAQVRETREQFKMSRREFAEACGFPSQTRLYNIEQKDSWKDGDREAVDAAITNLHANPPTGKRGRLKGESASERIDRLEAKLRQNGKLLREEDPVPETYDESLDPDYAAGLFIPVPDADGVTVPKGAVVIPLNQLTTAPDGTKVISNSEVGVWNRCRRKWWLSFYRRLIFGMEDYTGPRGTGNRVHKALAAWYVPEGEDRVDPRDALERAIVEDWTAITKQVNDNPHGDTEQVLADLATKFNDAIALERAMIEGYMQWVEETGADQNLIIVAPETAISHDLDLDVDGEIMPVRLIGKLDVRGTRTLDGVRVFMDHKTVGNFTEPRKTLHMNPQMLHYFLLEFLNSVEGDERCDAAIYNMLRKVKRSTQAKPPFYERIEVHHNSLEIEAYKRRVLGATTDIIRAQRRLDAGEDPMTVVYPTVEKDCAYMCDFFPICPMFDDGSRVEDAISSLYHEGDPLARYDRAEKGIVT